MHVESIIASTTLVHEANKHSVTTTATFCPLSCMLLPTLTSHAPDQYTCWVVAHTGWSTLQYMESCQISLLRLCWTVLETIALRPQRIQVHTNLPFVMLVRQTQHVIMPATHVFTVSLLSMSAFCFASIMYYAHDFPCNSITE